MKTILFSLLLASSATAQPVQMTIDLPTALRLADEQNTALAIQVQKVVQAELDRSAAWYQWIPTLRVGTSYVWQDGALQSTPGTVGNAERNARYTGFGAGASGSGLPSRPGLSAGIDLSEAIFGPLAAKQSYKAAKHGEDSMRRQVMLDVASAYYELVRANRMVEIAKLSADHAAALSKQTADFATSGEGLQADAERVEVESLIQQQKAEMADEQYAGASIRLASLLRLEDAVQLVPAEGMITPLSLMESGTSAEGLVAQALDTRPEIGQSRAAMAAEKARLKQEQYGIFLPRVEVGYSYGNFGGGTGTTEAFDDDRNDVYGMLYWQFDSLGLGNRNTIKKQRARMNEARAIEEQMMVDLAAEVRIAHTQLGSAERQLDLSRRAVDSARKSYELNSERIFENQGLPLEALQSVKALAEAESLYLSVAMKYNLAQLRLASATGKDLD